MTHSVQLIIGRDEAIRRFQARWTGARVVDLASGWQAIPLEEALVDEISSAFPAVPRPEELDLAPTGIVEALADATQAGGGLAYVETDYWGGTGGQSAVACVDGRMACGPVKAKGAGGAINAALRSIGVARSGGADEFDSIGLGERRTMDDYSPEGPRRLRKTVEPAPTTGATPERHLPTWLVVVLIVGFILLGILVASL